MGIKARFITYLLMVLLGTGIAYGLSLFGLLSLVNMGMIKSANYYDVQVPTIRNYILEREEELLDEKAYTELAEIIEGDHIAYEIRDKEGDRLYIYDEGKKLPIINWDKEQLLSEQKQVVGILGPQIIRYFPIVTGGQLKGSVVVAYTMANSADGIVLNWVANNMDFIIALLPLIYLVIFTLIGATRFIHTIEKPLEKLREGIAEIGKQNLDFSLSSESKDELGDLTRSFEEMRIVLKETLEANWQKEEERKNLISALSHDLRTPITIIKGYTEMLLDQEDRRIIKKVEAIDQNTNRLMKLVEDIQKVNQLHQIEYMMMPEVINFGKVIKQRLMDYEILLREKHLTFKYDIELYKESYKVDIHAFSEILDNLMSNSMRFTDEGGWVSVRIGENQQGMYLIVEDNGCGFQKEAFTHAFSLFYQGDESRNDKQHSGIGLYVVETLTKKMGGEVKIYNTAEGGAGVELSHLQID